MKLSIITTVLDSHDIVRRQLLYLDAIMPPDVEWVLVDDGSIPPIEIGHCRFPVVLHKTNNFNPWTEREARTEGVRRSRSERLICVDIDHMVTPKLISFVADTDYDFIGFRRKFAILNDRGELEANANSVIGYGVPRGRIKRRGLNTSPPGNCYAASKAMFWEMHNDTRKHRRLKHRVLRLVKEGRATRCNTEERPIVYTIPNGRHCGDVDANPFGLFHGLSRQTTEYAHAETVLI